MASDGIIARIDRPHSSMDYHWAIRIPHQPLPKPLKISGYEHARIVGDVFVALYLTGLLESFQTNPLKHRELEEDAKAKLKNYPHYIYFEIDRDTQHKGAIKSKANRYVKLGELFHVVFVTLNVERAEEILDELPKDRGTQFIVTLHELISISPLLEGFVTANRPTEMQYLFDILGIQSDVQSDGISQDNK